MAFRGRFHLPQRNLAILPSRMPFLMSSYLRGGLHLLAIVSLSVLGLSPTFAAADSPKLDFRDGEHVAFVGGSLAERMNLYGNFETALHLKFPDKDLVVRNFGWPADEVSKQQRPSNYTKIDDPMVEFGPETFICFFGFNESFDGAESGNIDAFINGYKTWLDAAKAKFDKDGREVRFALVSPIAFEKTDNPLLPTGEETNARLAKYSEAVHKLADERGYPFVDLFTPTSKAFSSEAGNQYTINGVHVNEAGDALISNSLQKQLFAGGDTVATDTSTYERVQKWVNDKSWFHLQDYRMLNGWYVYGGRRTWDTETFPKEFQKIRKMVAVRDQFIWDIVDGKPVGEEPDDSKTGEVFIPETMFGTRDDGFRKMREPKTLEYPTPEDSISQMTVPEGMEVQLFASEREFPEFSNPTQMTFDKKGRLWVSCMINYPQWLPGSAKPGDKLFIFEDTDGDGKADECKTFYDKLICPTGFEFYEDGILVVDEPRILFLRDTDGDDKADEVTQILDGIATDDTHHAMGAWEWSHGGLLYTLEGVSMSTTLETPWGPFRNQGPSGAYVIDPKTWKVRHFRTPGYGNPWCMVFDRWGMGIIGDGTNAQQHWTSPLSGYAVDSRRTLQPNFNNEGMRPAVGNEFLWSRHLPDAIQGQFIYACVINMHGLPRFTLHDQEGTAGFDGQRIEDLLNSTDMFFRPVDPQIGPDGAIWFGDWCNALIGHMQYSQRDPNRDHVHGRLYRLVNKNKPLLTPDLQDGKSIPALLDQLTSYELRTRYRARRELRGRDQGEILAAINNWISGDASDEKLCEAMWMQESFRQLDPTLVERILSSEDFHARAAAVHAVANEIDRYDNAFAVFKRAVEDEHPRVRLEGVRALSYVQTAEAAEVALSVITKPLDYWIEYTLEHTLHALAPHADAALANGDFLAKADQEKQANYYRDYKLATGPGGAAVKPLRTAENDELPKGERQAAIRELARIRGGNAKGGAVVFERVCSACHMIGNVGKKFGPALDLVGRQYNKEEIIQHVLWPNEKIAKGYETVQVVTADGLVHAGFVIKETDEAITLGVATGDGKGKEIVINTEDIDLRQEMKASSMPEGLMKTVAPSEFLDLIEYLTRQNGVVGGWIKTGEADKGALRKHGDFVEISRDADLKLGDDFDDNWSKYSHLVLSAVPIADDREFSFHSPNSGSDNPAVQVRLNEPAEMRHVSIQNRRNPTFYSRAKDLALWVSDDGKSWKQVWKSDEPKGQYEIDLPAGTRGKYLKVGLDGRGILHLNQIVVYGPTS